MPERYARFAREPRSIDEVDELRAVDVLASRLCGHLQDRDAVIDTVHVHGARSSAVQTVVGELLDDVGFRQEVVLTQQDGFVTKSRPDFFFELGPGRGVIAEVERGGTTTNNHDLKDFWKTHIAQDAHHLFLVVPMANWKSTGLPRERPFALVCHRLSAFFGDPRREVDVLSAHVFGYGRLAPA